MTLRHGLVAVSPMLVFLVLYVVVSLIVGDFYSMPIAVALAAAMIWGVAVIRVGSFTSRIELISKAAGSSNILYMIWIFILAGAFASLAKETGAVDATVALTLRWLPSSFLIPGLFLAACLISLSIGTSVGTVVALAPLAVSMAEGCNGNIAYFTAVVLGGAFFGDNLSFISDTTIAATRTQGCNMDDKFRANIRIVLPAAIVTLAVYILFGSNIGNFETPTDINYWAVLPYLLVIGLAVAGVNVTIVLTAGIFTAFAIALISGVDCMTLAGYLGKGIDSMGNLIIITLMAAGMLGLIKAAGGIDFILQNLTRRISSARGAKCAIALLVGMVNLCTANNTVAIITVGSLAKSISERFGIAPRRAASLLDTCSCIVQCLIPYGAQTLLASSLAGVSAAALFPYLYYPWALAVAVLAAIVIHPKRADRVR
jgi:Na+/H+ antiporter NhaC